MVPWHEMMKYIEEEQTALISSYFYSLNVHKGKRNLCDCHLNHMESSFDLSYHNFIFVAFGCKLFYRNL